MSNASSPEILSAYDAVRSNTDPTNWLLIGYVGDKGDALELKATGSGGLDELKGALDDGQAMYGYLRVEYNNDTESSRTKFILIIWIGEQTRVMRKARVSIESGAVKKTLSHHSFSVDARVKGDLVLEEIVGKCRKAGGADYNGGRG